MQDMTQQRGKGNAKYAAKDQSADEARRLAKLTGDAGALGKAGYDAKRGEAEAASNPAPRDGAGR